MNCKPGDVAYIVGAGLNSGRVVTVERRAFEGDLFVDIDGRKGSLETEGLVTWAVSGSSPLKWAAHDGVVRFYMVRAIADRWLRPLRDPGEDATDALQHLVGKPESAAIEWALGVRDVTPL